MGTCDASVEKGVIETLFLKTEKENVFFQMLTSANLFALCDNNLSVWYIAIISHEVNRSALIFAKINRM